jgi:N-acetylmuramoyl-L-alanine amidase CwlA
LFKTLSQRAIQIVQERDLSQLQSRGLNVPTDIFQHYDWSKKNCPRVLRAKPNGWQKFLEQVKSLESKLTSVPVATIGFGKFKDHHFLD